MTTIWIGLFVVTVLLICSCISSVWHIEYEDDAIHTISCLATYVWKRSATSNP